MDVRPAVPTDADALGVLHIRVWQDAYPGLMPQDHLDGMDADIPARQEWWRGALAEDPPPEVFVVDAAEPDELDGFVIVSPTPEEGMPDGTGRLMAIYVRTRAWDTGMGSALWRVAMERLADLGCTDATLWVLDTNARARAFYERKGWSPDGATQVDEREWARLSEVRYRGTVTG